MSFEDPGWRKPLLALPILTVPFVGMRRMGKMRESHPLWGLRSLWLLLVEAIWLEALLVWFIAGPDGDLDPSTGVVVVVGVAVGALAFVSIFARRPLSGDGPEGIAAAYRSRFFIGFAVSELPIHAAFVLSFMTGRSLVQLLIGAGASTVGMFLVAPTRRDIERCEGRLRSSGRHVELGRALNTSPPGDARGAT